MKIHFLIQPRVREELLWWLEIRIDVCDWIGLYREVQVNDDEQQAGFATAKAPSPQT